MKAKRIIAAAMAAALAVPMTVAFHSSAVTPIYPRGDVNYDTVFNLSDMVMFSRWLQGRGELENTFYADMNDDKSIDVYDFIIMRNELLFMVNEASARYKDRSSVNLCSGIQKNNAEKIKIDEKFQKAQLSFALSMFKETVKDDSNVLISPYSITQALAMTANGADGKTKEEMETVLGGIPTEQLNKYMNRWISDQSNDENCSIKSANSVWIRDDEKLINAKPEFIQNTVNFYNADIFKAPFDESTVTDINDWISEKTNKMIPSVIRTINDDSMMYLVNAVTFEAKWQDPYEEYQVVSHDFTAFDGSVKKTDMLSSMENYYIEDKNAKGFMKYYSDHRYAFAALLPNEDISVTDYVNSLTVEGVQKIFSNAEYGYVDSLLPKFKYEYSETLNDSLTDMGMETAFSPLNADFSNMVTSDSLPLYINNIKHKTFIELNEYGTKAAAATVVDMCGGAMIDDIHEVILDRPFVYAIVDTESGLPVFMGTLMEIS